MQNASRASMEWTGPTTMTVMQRTGQCMEAQSSHAVPGSDHGRRRRATNNMAMRRLQCSSAGRYKQVLGARVRREAVPWHGEGKAAIGAAFAVHQQTQPSGSAARIQAVSHAHHAT